jgi:hypothetical protein
MFFTKNELIWEHGGLRHEWKMFWWRQEIKKEIKKKKNIC